MVGVTNLVGCQSEEPTLRTESSDTNDDIINASRDIIDVIIDDEDPIRDIMQLYTVTSQLTIAEDTEDIDKIAEEVNEVIVRLTKEEGIHAFSEEATELVLQMTSSAQQAVKYRQLYMENAGSDNMQKANELHQSSLNELTKVSEFTIEYGELYDAFKANK